MASKAARGIAKRCRFPVALGAVEGGRVAFRQQELSNNLDGRSWAPVAADTRGNERRGQEKHGGGHVDAEKTYCFETFESFLRAPQNYLRMEEKVLQKVWDPVILSRSQSRETLFITINVNSFYPEVHAVRGKHRLQFLRGFLQLILASFHCATFS